RPGVGSGLYFKDRLGTNVNTGGIGPRSRDPLNLVSRSDPRALPVRPAAFPVRARPDRPDRPDVRNRPDHPDHPDHPDRPDRPDVRTRPDHPDHPDRPSEQPRAREPERREPSRGNDRPAVERPRDSGGRDRGSSPPPSRGGGGGGGGGGNHGGGIAGGALALLGALCFAELATRHPAAGGKYVYVREAFGPRAGFVVGWVEGLAIYPAAIAGIAVVAGEYTGRLAGLEAGHTRWVGA